MKFLTVFASIIVLCSSCKEDPQEPVLPDPTPNLATFEGEIGTNDNSTITSNDNNLLICGNTGIIGSGICLLKISKMISAPRTKMFLKIQIKVSMLDLEQIFF